MRIVQWATAVAAAGAIVVAGCSSSAAPSSTPAPAGSTVTPTATQTTANAIQIATFKFAPASLQVARGSTVTWANQDQILHTVSAGTPTAKSAVFDQRLPDVGATFKYEFKDAGTFPYFCDIHQFMTGEVVVR